MTAGILDGSVWDAVESALRDPEILTRAITNIARPVISSDGEVAEMKTAIEKLGNEEARILEAYRLSLLTPEQLARELDLLVGRRNLLEGRSKELSDRQSQLPIRRSVDDYCQTIHERLSDLSFATKRSILRLLLKRVIVEGDQVRICGIIPLSSGIANTTNYSHERNPTTRTSAFAEFLLVRKIKRPTRASFVEAVAA